VYGAKEVAYKVGNFQKQMFEVGVEGIQTIAKWIRKSAKLRAPRGATNELAEGITIGDTKFSLGVGGEQAEITISSTAPYAKYQEYGYRPHKVGPDWIGDWLTFKGLWEKFPKGFVKVKGYKPHIRPAIEAVAPYVSEIAQGIPMKAARRAGLGGGR